jgi:hypothetical protein
MESLMRHQLVAVMLSVLIAISLVGPTVYSKADKTKQIHISFEQKPAKKIDQSEVYLLHVSWINKDKTRSYDACFVFTVERKDFKVTSNDLTFIFNGSIIHPQRSDESLRYYLPQQTFPSGESGTITVEITYNNSGKYYWEIAIAETI